MSTMQYKDYAAHIEYSEEDGCLIGHIVGIRDIIGFHADNVADLKAAFIESVDDYLEHCKNTGKTPNKPYSGKLSLRIAPELHAKIAMQARVHGKSINQWASDVLAHA